MAFCPHDLFPNTKSDLGACGKLHDEALRAEFQKSNKVVQYEAEFLGYLERLISDLERYESSCFSTVKHAVRAGDSCKLYIELYANMYYA